MNKLTIEHLLYELRLLGGDREADHLEADRLLLEYIDDPEVTKAFENIPKWYGYLV